MTPNEPVGNSSMTTGLFFDGDPAHHRWISGRLCVFVVEFCEASFLTYAPSIILRHRGRSGLARNTTGFSSMGSTARRGGSAGVMTITHAYNRPAYCSTRCGALSAGPADGANQHTPPSRYAVFIVLFGHDHRTRGDAPQAQ